MLPHVCVAPPGMDGLFAATVAQGPFYHRKQESWCALEAFLAVILLLLLTLGEKPAHYARQLLMPLRCNTTAALQHTPRTSGGGLHAARRAASQGTASRGTGLEILNQCHEKVIDECSGRQASKVWQVRLWCKCSLGQAVTMQSLLCEIRMSAAAHGLKIARVDNSIAIKAHPMLLETAKTVFFVSYQQFHVMLRANVNLPDCTHQSGCTVLLFVVQKMQASKLNSTSITSCTTCTAALCKLTTCLTGDGTLYDADMTAHASI